MGRFLLLVLGTFAVLMLVGRGLVARSRAARAGDTAAGAAAIGAVGWLLRLSGWIALFVVSLAVVTFVVSERALSRRHDAPMPSIPIPTDSVALARGDHLVETIGCTGCHGPDLGGRVFFDVPGVARLVAPNLTRGPGGRGAEYTDMELARALREGFKRTGHLMFAMPTAELHRLTDADLGAVVASVRRRPPVASTHPPTLIRVLGRVGIATGKYRPSYMGIKDQVYARPAATPAGATVEHGKYVAMTVCAACHSADGEPTGPPDVVIPPMDALAAYDLPSLTRAVRAGTAMDGRRLHEIMTTSGARHATDEELGALALYLRSRLATVASRP